MSNQLISLDTISKELLLDLNKLSPAMLRAFVYHIQSSMGGFPRDRKIEKEIADALRAEDNDSQHRSQAL